MVSTDKHQEHTAITRSLILQNVLDSDSDSDDGNGLDCSLDSLMSSWHTDTTVKADEHVEDDGSLPTGASLEDTMAWLDAQCEAEQARFDSVQDPEYQPESGPAELDRPNRGLDTAVLNRIRRGYGPRSSKFEDLLWPLRLNTSAGRFNKRPWKESSEAMAEVLLNWNKHVASAYDDPDTRIDLIDAMQARVSFLNRILSHRRSADAHDDTSRKLLHAIHAYRPETADFETQDTCNLLTIILAHIGFAIPDIDQELKYLIFYTLVTERVHMAHVANADTRRRLEGDISIAKKRRDSENVVKYEQKLIDWSLGVFENNCDIIALRVKIARRNVELKALEELQTLTVLQTAQKIVLDERLAKGKSPAHLLIPRSTWLPAHSSACMAADANLDDVVNEHMTDLLANVKVASRNTADMKYITRARILTRALKFAGLDLTDVSEKERRKVVKERMANPGTVSMMGNAVEGITETQQQAREMADAMDAMELKLAQMLRRAEEQQKEYEDLERLVHSDVSLAGDEVVHGGSVDKQ
jgi:hypothetical protein